MPDDHDATEREARVDLYAAIARDDGAAIVDAMGKFARAARAAGRAEAEAAIQPLFAVLTKMLDEGWGLPVPVAEALDTARALLNEGAA